MHSNNEVGTIQDIRELARIASSRGVLFHTDAAQSVGKVRVNVEELGVDFLTVAGHKFYAPKGIGALYIRSGRKLPPLLHGAGHERGLRPGTENTASIVGLGAAAMTAMPIIDPEGSAPDEAGQEAVRRTEGCRPRRSSERPPGTETAEHLEHQLWRVSTLSPSWKRFPESPSRPGAACHGDLVEPSHVLAAMGVDPRACPRRDPLQPGQGDDGSGDRCGDREIKERT